MNSRLTTASSTIRFKPVSRAQFSPVRSHQRIAPDSLSTGAGETPVTGGRFRKPDLNVTTPRFSGEDHVIRLAPAWPSWHRGPLDRMQTPLTRFRD